MWPRNLRTVGYTIHYSFYLCSLQQCLLPTNEACRFWVHHIVSRLVSGFCHKDSELYRWNMELCKNGPDLEIGSFTIWLVVQGVVLIGLYSGFLIYCSRLFQQTRHASGVCASPCNAQTTKVHADPFVSRLMEKASVLRLGRCALIDNSVKQ